LIGDLLGVNRNQPSTIGNQQRFNNQRAEDQQFAD
jgi:hypothetical protein